MQRYLDATTTTADSRYKFQKFKPKWFKPGSVGVMIGKKGSGKTTVMQGICYALRHCPEVTLFQKTYETNPAFHDIVPGLCCFTTWRTDIIRNIMKRQNRENKKRLREELPPRYHTIIIDDFASDDSFCKDKVLIELIYNARWLKINLLITMQFSLNLSTALRGNIDWVFMLRESMPGNRKRLFDHYAGHFGIGAKGLERFSEVFDRMTDNFGCMVMRNTGNSNDIHDSYFFYKAPLRDFNADPKLPRWRMGSRALWAFNARHFNKHWDSSSDDDANSDEMIIDRRR